MATKSYEFETQGRHKSANVIQVELMHMDVDRIQEVFQTHFLQPNDKIILWKVISCKDINNAISDIRILLGLNKVPPMTPTAEILLQNLRLRGSENEDDPITKYFRSYMKFFEAADWEDEESAAEALSVYNFAKDLFETSERNHINRIKELEELHPRQHVGVYWNMFCTIKYCRRYCQYCLSTDHLFQHCPNKSCALCGNKKHPKWKCPQRCHCERGPYHLEADCKGEKRRTSAGSRGGSKSRMLV